MKLFMISLFSIFVFNAQAMTWFQSFCSNPDSTIRIADGDSEQYVFVTSINLDNYVKTPVDVSSQVTVTFSQVKEIKETSKNCDEELGFWEAEKMSVREIVVQKSDNSQFDENILGLSEDKRSITTSVFCSEKRKRGIVPCQ